MMGNLIQFMHTSLETSDLTPEEWKSIGKYRVDNVLCSIST